MEQEMEFGLKRRSFIKGGLTVGCLAAVAGIAGCSPGAPSEGQSASESTTGWLPEKWDFEADLVTVGAGGAGLSSGIEGCDQGMEVILLESQPNVGGNSAICNGGIAIPGSPLQKEGGIEDSPEQMYKDLSEYLEHDANQDYLKLISEQEALLWDWLIGMGVEFEQTGLLATTGMSLPREHHTNPGVVINILNDNAKGKGADIRLNTKATRLIQDPVSKRVLGVEAEIADGEKMFFKARKGVLLAAGGYARNPGMLNKWVFGKGAEELMEFCYDAIGQDGSGILMAMDIGAQTRHIDYINLLTAQNPKGKKGDACSMFHVGAVLVNLEGKRFVNEQKGYIGVWPDVNLQTNKSCFQIWDEPIAQAYAENDSSYYSMKKIEATGLMFKADTYEELASQMGIPVDAFVSTMNKYNSDIEGSGRDSIFGREHLVSMSGEPLILNHPPYYGFETTNNLTCTKGGLEQDTECRCVDIFGDSIPSLYVAGNISGYCNMGIKPGTREAVNTSGTGFGGAMACGRYCAQKIAELDSWDEA
jgi:flavocytochrome c